MQMALKRYASSAHMLQEIEGIVEQISEDMENDKRRLEFTLNAKAAEFLRREILRKSGTIESLNKQINRFKRK